MTNNDFILKCTNCVNLRSCRTMYSTNGLWLKSMCYMENENALVLCYATNGNSYNSIEKVSYSDMSRISFAVNLSYGYVNDITYNPITNKLYVTPMEGSRNGSETNVIYVLNATTFTKESEIHIGTDTLLGVYGIAYDQINNQYYVTISDNEVAVLNSSFEIITTFNLKQHGVNSYGNKFQSLEFYDEKLFFLYYEKVVVYDNEGNYLNNFATSSDLESKGLASLGNGDFILGKVYDNNKGKVFTELLTFNFLDCRDVVDLLPTEVGATVPSPHETVSGINYINKIGNIVQCSLCITNITSVGSNVVATIPVGYRPKHYMRVIGVCSGSNYVRFEIAPSGNIMITATSLTSIQSSHWFELQVAYLVD